MDRHNKQTTVHTDNPRRGVSVHRNVSRSWFKQPHNYQQSDRGDKRHGHYKYLPTIACLLFGMTPVPVRAETVGGVSATAAPVANSSGSVTNQAIQVLQGPYITNTYGNGIQCQGPTMNFTPYITHSISDKDPFEQRYFEPQYDMRDFVGRTVQVTKIAVSYTHLTLPTIA